EQAAGTLDVQGTMTQNGGAFRYLGGTINGNVTIAGGALLIGTGATGPASFTLDGVSTATLADNLLAAGQSLTARRNSSAAQGLPIANGFVNSGSVYVAGTTSASTLTVSSGTLVNTAAGLVQFQAGGTTRSFVGNLTNNGTVQVNQTTTFSAGTFEQAAGTLA